MKKLAIFSAGLLASGAVAAENVEDANSLICAATQVQICFETGECFPASTWELSIPDFVVIDLEEKTVSTTEASGLNRSSPFSSVTRADGLISLQGAENQRLFSFAINEQSGHLTATIVNDGLSVTVFGACTATTV